MEELVLSQNMVSSIRQALTEGLTIAAGAKSSATYYHKKDDQLKAITSQVIGMYKLSKELPLIVACQKGVTGTFISQALLNEFRNTSRGGACNIVNPKDWYDNSLNDKAILSALHNLAENGLPYVLRLFVEMKKNKVNNDRSRKIMLGYIWGLENIEFYALKYRNKIGEILRHAYGKKFTSILTSIAQKQVNIEGANLFEGKELNIANEYLLRYFNGSTSKAFKLLLFILKKDKNVTYSVIEFPLLSEYQKAKLDIRNIVKIPEEVLLGLIGNKKHPQHETMWKDDVQKEATKALIRKNTEVTSANQQLRQTKSTAKLGVEKTVEVEKVTDYLALYKTGYETTFTPELKTAIDKLAEKKKINGFFYENLGIIVDDSVSMTGDKNQSKNTPRAIADFTAKVLKKSSKNAVVVKTTGQITDLAGSFVELLKKEDANHPYDAIITLTDGYENSYDGLLNEMINIWKSETNRNIPTFQISPIVSAEMGANIRKLGSNFVALAINNPAALQAQINSRLLEIDTKRWLLNQVKVLESSPVKRIKKSVNA